MKGLSYSGGVNAVNGVNDIYERLERGKKTESCVSIRAGMEYAA
jgi:hypothetical protein